MNVPVDQGTGIICVIIFEDECEAAANAEINAFFKTLIERTVFEQNNGHE